ncbi:MAG: type II toxin-antitoxin system Phd/YefM family antitoxin [Deltaproteobacteria bacterium]|jgi:antitoxin StbD|nr:type II toxin-antitoxin system Phd/YefM family antitoxin [Deltaproteobacteria bacterium]MBT4268372.1 type II toxin-antitoxin system Phd/YefM family antitoxin [Deltaproteobacteria bacterium]MBT4638993.1 type II toxin-antitoxin system Phd/YefM family antitoxin [Deltaproteobacteria bacterium]MBT6499141.1 type II toxin-antitoxin system Phd/YefM family antitoxin [Deltaproteobacteria bacterium]MBT6611075.1 type II toxin-antitoxin system Phd/YefM family antitoxin [Deltaproteobacteria bacterium]
MKSILATCSASISELKKNPSALLLESDGAPIAILNHNKPTAYLIPAETYEAMIEQLDDYELGLIIKQREQEKASAIEVSVDDL